MLYGRNWDRVQQRYAAWLAGENDTPLVQARAPRGPQTHGFTGWNFVHDMRRPERAFEAFLERTHDLLRSASPEDLGTINELFIVTQPAHLQKLAGKELKPEERDVFRADLIRSRLGSGRRGGDPGPPAPGANTE